MSWIDLLNSVNNSNFINFAFNRAEILEHKDKALRILNVTPADEGVCYSILNVSNFVFHSYPWFITL